jgi:hypothetical protein
VIVAFMLNYTLLKLKIVCKYGDLKDWGKKENLKFT